MMMVNKIDFVISISRYRVMTNIELGEVRESKKERKQR